MVVGAISLIIGLILFAAARSKKDAQSKAWERFLLIVAPAGLIAILLFVYNLCRSPLLVYRAQQGAVQQAEARVKQVESEKKEIATNLEQEKDKSQPKFELGWGTSIIGNDVVVRGNHKERHTHIFLPVTVLNHGAPSIIRGLRVTAKLKDGRELEGSAFIPSQPEFVFHMPDESLKFSTSASLAARGTANPIPTGGQVDGYVFYEFPPDILKELRDPATLFILQVTDIAGNIYQGRITMSGPKPTQMSTSPGLLPLH